jgi:sugar phosphate isomerase/epimerase
LWWESGIKNHFTDGFFLIAHGPPVEEPFNDVTHLWHHYLPELMKTVDTACRMQIKLLTIHMCVDSRNISSLVLTEKIRALEELTAYAKKNGVKICLENVSESAEALKSVFNAVPDLGLTLDIGHAELYAETNSSFEIIEKLGHAICHVHLHDNYGGQTRADDLHLPIGEGIVEFATILNALIKSGYNKTMTFELKHHALLPSLKRVQDLIEMI